MQEIIAMNLVKEKKIPDSNDVVEMRKGKPHFDRSGAKDTKEDTSLVAKLDREIAAQMESTKPNLSIV